RCREIPRRIEQVFQRMLLAYAFKGSFTNFHSPAVTPNYGISEGVAVFIDHYQPMHLVSNADSSNILRLEGAMGCQFSNRQLRLLPPHIRRLFCPTRYNRKNGVFLVLRILGRNDASLRICIYYRDFYGRGADINT